MITGIRRICVGVSDLTGALTFFAETLSLPILREVALRGQPTSWEMGFGLTGTSLSILEQAPDHPTAVPGKMTVIFETDDMRGDYEALRAKGVAFTGPPVVEEWHGTVAYFEGPDGITLGLLQPKQTT